MAKGRSILQRVRKPHASLSDVSLCIYSRNGVGKTTLLRTMKGRGLVLDVRGEGGGTSVLVGIKNIDIIEIGTWEELDDVYQAFKKGELKYDWVAIDSVTSCQQLAKRKVVRERDEIISKAYQIRLQDWGSIGQLMGELFLRFQLLPIIVIFVAQEKRYRLSGDDEDEGSDVQYEIRPLVSPSALEALTPALHLIGRYYTFENDEGKTERRLRVQPHPSFVCKSRSIYGRKLPKVIRNPKLSEILGYMMGSGDKKPRAAPDESIVDLGEGD